MPLTPQSLGFVPLDPDQAPEQQSAWRLALRGQLIEFRRLERLEELLPVEAIERETLGMTDLDVIPASELVVVPETGGAVLGAFLTEPGGGRRMVAAGFGWGGYVQGRPRIVSDFLGVRADARSLGIGEAMKRLQAGVAALGGFLDIIWTVDPLRAANARLNFLKLGAYSDHYERDRYGREFGQAHYGGLPSDRLHITWPLDSRRTQQALRAPLVAPVDDCAGAFRYVAISGDIDRVLAAAPDQALSWRLRVRNELEALFADGWAVTGFAPAAHSADQPRLVLEHLPRQASGLLAIDASSFCPRDEGVAT